MASEVRLMLSDDETDETTEKISRHRPLKSKLVYKIEA
jgi:hypothetical protein